MLTEHDFNVPIRMISYTNLRTFSALTTQWHLSPSHTLSVLTSKGHLSPARDIQTFQI